MELESVKRSIIAEEMLLNEIEKVMKESGKDKILVAIDGRCASGKTTLAGKLAERCESVLQVDHVHVIHMDDFFLRPEQRTRERLSEPGGNVDRERVLEEVLIPIAEGRSCTFRPFDCRIQGLKSPILIEPGRITIVEGAYSCHPLLREFYDLKIFMDVEPEEQMRRIRIRNGEEGAEHFRTRWIPLEERYFTELHVREACDICGEAEQI